MKRKFGILLGAGFLVLSSMSAATGNVAVRLEQAAKQNAAETPTAPALPGDTTSSGIAIQRISLAQTAATGFGKFEARSNVITPGTPFHIYFEPTNLTTRFENGKVRASMSVDILVRNAQGKTVAAQDNAWQLPLVRTAPGPAPLTEVYGDLTVNHLKFPDGDYKMVLRIHDDLNNTFADHTLDLQLRSATATVRQRLSQTTPATDNHRPGQAR